MLELVTLDSLNERSYFINNYYFTRFLIDSIKNNKYLLCNNKDESVTVYEINDNDLSRIGEINNKRTIFTVYKHSIIESIPIINEFKNDYSFRFSVSRPRIVTVLKSRCVSI